MKSAYDEYPTDKPIPLTHAMKFHKGIIDFIFYSSNR